MKRVDATYLFHIFN